MWVVVDAVVHRKGLAEQADSIRTTRIVDPQDTRLRQRARSPAQQPRPDEPVDAIRHAEALRPRKNVRELGNANVRSDVDGCEQLAPGAASSRSPEMLAQEAPRLDE